MPVMRFLILFFRFSLAISFGDVFPIMFIPRF
jgi:hypothetical protein